MKLTFPFAFSQLKHSLYSCQAENHGKYKSVRLNFLLLHSDVVAIDSFILFRFSLLLLHGWPGSVREFYDVISLFSKPSKNNIAFEVIVPSLPGYGWSDPAAKKGLGPLKISVILRNLMLRVGSKKFYVQGGDWGSIIGSNMAAMFPENVIGKSTRYSYDNIKHVPSIAYHSNMCAVNTPVATIKTILASFYPSLFIEEEKLISWIYPFTPKFIDLLQESGLSKKLINF